MAKSENSQKIIPKSFWQWFIAHLTANPLIIVVVVVGTAGIIFCRLLIPIFLGQTVDIAIIDKNNLLTDPQQLAQLTNYVKLIFSLAILQFLISILTTLANERLSWTAQRRIREEFFDSMQNKPLKFHDSVRTGELMALATNDLGQVGGLISPGFGMMANVFISLIFSSYLILEALNAPVLILISIPFLIVYLWAVFAYNKKMAPISATFMRKWSAIATAVQDNITGAEVVRAFAEESYEREKFMKYVLDFRETWYTRQIIQARYFPSLVLFAAIGFSVAIGSLLIAAEEITIGNLIAYNGLLFTLLGPTYVISFAVAIFNGGLAGAKRIHAMEIREEREDSDEKGDKIDVSNIQGLITFENVSFKYPTSKKWILEDISFTAAPGQTIAIVGPTGSGKSSLTKLLLRLYDYEGTIKLDGFDIRDISLESLRKSIGRIEQDIYLFPRSVKENIAFGARNASQEKIEKAAKLAQAHDFIMKDLPKKYESNVGEGGSRLSGGQRQRIALARTFLTDPPILILDDSTSSVDSKTEEEIVKAIRAVSHGRTTFIITHRLSTIRSADCILVIKGSKIVARGHHSKLIHTSPDFRRIFGKNVELPPLQIEKDPIPTGGGK
ncbi:MAG: ABC transporter ATP-binding protein [Candidatus Heimdallarchaeota archaeon]|nr:ABC transporter ATP-binding protein [Candidatus Heimdallarchaeota archaeon]